MATRPSLVAIVGQTASGKSQLGVVVATAIAAEIIAADSKTVYRGLDIGTAKPTLTDQLLVRHHLLDVADCSTDFSVAQFQTLAKAAWVDINQRQKLALVVGGSGFYVSALLANYDFSAPAANWQLRRQLSYQTTNQLQNLICRRGLVLPTNSTNRRALIRTIERGSVQSTEITPNRQYPIVGLKHPREILVTRITQRFEQMLLDGVIKEAQWAWQVYPKNHQALKGNIYQSLRPYLLAQASLEEVRADFIKRDLRLAKKQLTWFKRWRHIVWFSDPEQAKNHLIQATLRSSAAGPGWRQLSN